VIDAIDLIGGNLAIAGNKCLNFYTENACGPTGVIWKGSTVDVTEPETLSLFVLGLLGLTYARRQVRG